MTALASEPRNAHLICELLYRALKQEEEEIRKIGRDDARIEHFLRSVAFAPELVMGYLLRKEALRQGIPVEFEKRFNDGGVVDICFVEDGKYTALCELKGPWGKWRTDTVLLRNDVIKILAQECSDVSPRRYNAWIVVARNETTSDELREWVEKTVAKIAVLDEYEVSPALSVNRVTDKAPVWNGKPYECLQGCCL